MSKLIKPRGAPRRARRKLEGKEAEIYRALTEEDETVTSLAKRLGISRWTLARFIREEMEARSEK